MKTHYPVEIHYSTEDGGFIATFPDLPGCSAWGATEAAGNPIPEPSPLTDEADYSGRFVMRIPKRLHADLVKSAKRQGVSLNQYVLYLLAARAAVSGEARA